MTQPLRVDFHDETFHFNDLYATGKWEPQTKAILTRFLHKGDLFLDVGAWLGPVSLWAVELGAQVLALEPDPIAYEQLLINIEGYPVTPLPAALSDHDGVGWLSNPRFLGDSQSRITAHGEGNFELIRTVSPRTLFTGIQPALVKIDIEGHELVIIEDVATICAAQSIPILVAWHEPWWTRTRPPDHYFDHVFAGFDLTGEIAGFGQTLAVPKR